MELTSLIDFLCCVEGLFHLCIYRTVCSKAISILFCPNDCHYRDVFVVRLWVCMLDTLTLKLHLQGVQLSLLHMQLPKFLTKQTIEEVMRSQQYMIWKGKRSFDYHTTFYIHSFFFFFFFMESILLQKYKHSFIESQGSVTSKGLVTMCFPSNHTIESPFIVELPGEV